MKLSHLIVLSFIFIISLNAQEDPGMKEFPPLVSEEVMAEYQAKLEEMNNPNVALHAHAVCQLRVDEYTQGLTQHSTIRNRINTRADGAEIIVTYNGFTPQAQEAFQYAVDIWASCLDSDIPIRIAANYLPLAPGVMGAAGPVMVHRDAPNLVPGTFYGEALADKLTGIDISGPGIPDINANFSSTFSWYFGTDGNPPPGKYDFVTVVLHELGHGLGFFSNATATSEPVNGVYGLIGFPFIFDRFIQDGGGITMTSIAPASVVSPIVGAFLQSDDIFFSGSMANSANAGSPVKLFAPNPFIVGKSYSHWDEALFPATDANSLMTPFIAPQEAIHNVGPATLGAFEDMGWTILSKEVIPTMSEWGLIILSLLLMTFGILAVLRKKAVLS
jgi:hypothetical protein